MKRAAILMPVCLAVLASALLCEPARRRDVSDMSRYVIKDARPRIWLTHERLAALKRKADRGDADWLAIKASADEALANPGAGNVLDCALVYQVTGEEEYAAAAISALKGLCAEMQTVFSGTSYDRKWNTGKWIGNSFAVAYDWVREAMNDEDVRELVESPGLATAAEWLTKDYAKTRAYDGTTRPHVGTNTWIHWAENMGMVWLALHGDTPKAEEWGRSAMIAASVWTAYHREVLKGGASFAAIGYGTAVNANMFKFCEAVRTAAGVDLWADLGDWPEEVVFRWIYWTGPDFKTINHYGHHKRSFDYNVLNDNQEIMMLYLADHLRGKETGALARGWLDNCSPFPRANGAAFDRFLLGSADMPAADPGGLPLCYLSEYRGEVVARSDWTSNATWVSFRCGNTHTGEFFRPDAGHINITKGTQRFAADAGSDEYSWGAHGSDFRNTIAIGADLQIPWRTWAEKSGYRKMWQKTPEVLAKKAELLRTYEEAFGTLLALEDRGDYVYAAGDFAGAYNVPGTVEVAKECTRQLLFLRPNTVVLFDRVTAASESPIEWRCHTPTLDAARPWGEKPKRRNVTALDDGFLVKADDYAMVCRTLLPAGAAVSVSPLNSLNQGKGFPGWQMVRVTTGSPVRRTCFLHVMEILPSGAETPKRLSAETVSDRVVLKLSVGKTEYVVSFNAEGDCGGTIKVGPAAETPFAETIVPDGLLINRPAPASPEGR